MIEYLIAIAMTSVLITMLITMFGGNSIYLILSIIAVVVLFALNIYLDRRDL